MRPMTGPPAPMSFTDPAPSGIGSAKPSFVHNSASGATATPPMPMLSEAQFGAMPNFSAPSAPQVHSALLTPASG